MTYFESDTIDAIANRLWACAQAQQLITYRELAPFSGLEPHDPRYWKMLGRISQDTNEAMGIMLSALVVNVHDGFPGAAFFALAEDLGRSFNDKLEFWAREVRRVHSVAGGGVVPPWQK